MKNVLKSKRKETFLAKDIENKYYEHIKDINEIIVAYDQNGNVTELKEYYSGHCYLSKYQNGNIVKECNYIDGRCHQKFEYEYDEQGYLKPYAFDYWWEASYFGKKTLEIESDNYGNRIERYSEPLFDGDSNTFIYKNGNLIEEHYREFYKLLDCYNTYDDKGRLILKSIDEWSGDEIILKYYYNDEDEIILLKKAVIERSIDDAELDNEVDVEQCQTTYSLREFIVKEGILSREILYNIEAESVDIFLNNDIHTKDIIEITEYIREEEELETTPYMEDKNGPFILKIEQKIANDFLQSKLIEIYDKTSDMLLKSIKISGYNSIDFEDGVVQVEETIYEYYS